MILDFKFQPHKSDSQLETCNSPKVNSMRREWITKEGSRILTLFFCGWGMDERAVQHVKGKGDLLLFYDYRDISGEEAPEVEGYESVRVVAWSMGVWAASVLLSRWNIPVSYRVAINGTERPVDEHYGIHPKIYLLTEGRNGTFQGKQALQGY